MTTQLPAPCHQSPDAAATLYHADCFDVMSAIPDASVDMVLCDPPYGITCNVWDTPLDLDRLWACYNRIVKPNGAVVLLGHGLFTCRLALSNPRDFKYKIVWDKGFATGFLNANKQPLRRHEDILVFYRKQCVFNPQKTPGKPYVRHADEKHLTTNYRGFVSTGKANATGERSPVDIIRVDSVNASFKASTRHAPPDRQPHPTQKPVDLGRYLIRTYTNPGDTVLDNCCGSGSFLVAAMLEGRKSIGIEQSETYCAIASRRLAEAFAQDNTTAAKAKGAP